MLGGAGKVDVKNGSELDLGSEQRDRKRSKYESVYISWKDKICLGCRLCVSVCD